MNRVLILIPYYFPGFKSGGPQQTIKNFVEIFGNDADIFIYTQNCDYNNSDPYADVVSGEWIEIDNIRIMYESPEQYCRDRLKTLYKEFQTIYSCGLFEKNSIHILLLHRKLGGLHKTIYIAPMGVFSEGALRLKWLKKMLFLKLFCLLGCFNNIIWSFTSMLEMNDAKKVLGENSLKKYIVAEDLPRNIDFSRQKSIVDRCIVKDDELRIIFLSRICPKKNLSFCFDILNNQYCKKIIFDIYGILEDRKYWKDCLTKKELLPEGIKVNYCGEVNPEDVIDVFSKYDIFLFPSQGENYGHVIYEALSAGCIPIISDRTPWNKIEDVEVGYVNELENVESFQTSIHHLCKYTKEEICKKKKQCILFAEKTYFEAVSNSGYKSILG